MFISRTVSRSASAFRHGRPRLARSGATPLVSGVVDVAITFGSFCGELGVEGRELPHHNLVLGMLIGVDRLSVLTEIVETGELLATVT